MAQRHEPAGAEHDGGTTSTKPAPVPEARSSKPAFVLPRRKANARRAATKAQASSTESNADRQARTMLVAAARRTAASPARRRRSASSPAATVASIGPATIAAPAAPGEVQQGFGPADPCRAPRRDRHVGVDRRGGAEPAKNARRASSGRSGQASAPRHARDRNRSGVPDIWPPPASSPRDRRQASARW